MKIQLILLTGLILTVNTLFAQNVRFPTSGVIEFEKSINMYALLKKSFSNPGFSDHLEKIKQSIPQFKVLKSKLTFSAGKTLFSPADDPEGLESSFGILEAMQFNVVYTDFSKGSFTTQKKIFDETLLVKDSTRKINWKLTNEMRTIAGYECRRANALIMDSVYVVAFYTDKIPVSGGPESFTGLPGMILGLALPHDNITWFAKNVTDRPVQETELKEPVKGKPLNNQGLLETINDILKSSGAGADVRRKYVVKVLSL